MSNSPAQGGPPQATCVQTLTGLPKEEGVSDLVQSDTDQMKKTADYISYIVNHITMNYSSVATSSEQGPK